jgi:hypothetical protein
MKKILMILGGIALILIILIASSVSYVAFKGHQLDASSKAYVDTNATVLFTTWSKDELLKRSSIELRKNLNDQADLLFSKLKHLGTFQRYEGSVGQSYISLTFKSGRVITAEYAASASFQNGPAQMNLKLIRENGQWQICDFAIYSPIFAK